MAEADNVDSDLPRRRSSTLLPKADVTLPNLGDIVPYQQAEHRHSLQGPSLPALFVPGVSELLLDGKPILQYKICGKIYTMEKPPNEVISTMTRVTVGGRKLTYRLRIIQQPARARACGAGPRSSADRRPVDPPPVIELIIRDENTNEDITMWYDAGFMLYASLDTARPIAHGRMHTSPHPPVLTGVAVASTAYLERPEKAGYFIFPDLSVRHEGWYRLKFSLFEAVKHAEDADIDRPFHVSTDNTNQDVMTHQSMANRMEVQSEPFQVFSAKKFPGLKESTPISRIVADQGCRVRIRREIRQRKRNTEEKPDDDHRSTRTSPAPSHQLEHVRSASHSSDYYRQSSIDYSRPTPSRNPSVISSTQPSPLQMPTMAPPPIKHDAPSMHSPKYVETKYMAPRLTLPPIRTLTAGPEISFNSVTRQYSLPEKAASKRSSSPTTYDYRSSMKAGSRPDTHNPLTVLRSPGVNDHIEVDNGQDGEDDQDDFVIGPLKYVRANGEVHFKYPAGGPWNRRPIDFNSRIKV